MASETFRDAWGIPHLRADSVTELARLQGRTAALDRAWQLDWQRRRAEGRTAEAVGPAGVDFDRFARRARVAGTAEDSFVRLDEETRGWCVAFVDGVNSGLAEGASGAHEFDRLQIRPGSWQPWTPLAVFAIQQLLFGGFPDKLWRHHLAGGLGDDTVALLSAESGAASGSNAWAVAGDLTAGGRPMIAGDPHRSVDIPGVYQQVHLACPEFDVVGFTFPGVPGAQHFAHTGEVAWAITNAMADYQDLFVEELDRGSDRVRARGPRGWEPANRSVESITVRDSADETIEVIETDRGPVIIDEPGGPVISLRTPTRVERDAGFDALLPLLRAGSVADVEAAFRRWVEPVNSAVVADRSGQLRHLVAGRVPLRDPANRDRVVPAWDPQFAWSGSYAAMPAEAGGRMLVSANDRTSGGGLGTSYAAPYRADRIRDRLEEASASGPLDAATMAAIHQDSRLGEAAAAQRLLGAVPLSGPAATVRDEIVGWDQHMAADSGTAALFAAWRAHLVAWLATHPRLAVLRDPGPLPSLYEPWMNHRARIGAAFWAILHNGDALGIDLAAGAAVAVQQVADDPPSGVWGDRHRLAPLHGLAGLRAECVPPLPHPGLSGDHNCVLATSSTPGIQDGCSIAPMARYVWDLTDRSASRWVVPFGASGRPADRHFADQTASWAAGELVPVITDWSQLIKES